MQFLKSPRHKFGFETHLPIYLMLGIFSNLLTFHSAKRVSRNGNDEIFYDTHSYSVTLLTQVILQDSRDSVVIKREEPKPNWFSFGYDHPLNPRPIQYPLN